MIHRLLIAVLMLAGLTIAPPAGAEEACRADPDAATGLNAVLYDQRSIEHALITEQTFRAATAALKSAKASPGDALMPDAPLPKVTKARPPAVILDIDETVLDNSPAQAFQVKSKVAYCDAAWQRWVASRAAAPVPGAVAFTQAAARAGVKVFYVTNRACPPVGIVAGGCPAKTDTMANMERLGFARANDPKAFLLKNERPDWTDDKSSRRAVIAADNRVIMMLGDQLTDFVSPATADQIWTQLQTPIVSGAIAALPPGDSAYRRYRAIAGKRWFVLPNAQYGFYLKRFKTIVDRLDALQAADIAPPPPPRPPSPALTLATWNAEWFMDPVEFDKVAARGCSSGGANPVARSLPCDVAKGTRNKRRSADDLTAQARYAAGLNADIVALQEVDGPGAAKLLFPAGYSFCFAMRVATNPDGSTEAPVQDVGFAVRDGVAFECKSAWREIGLPDNSVRWAAQITVSPNTHSAIDMMAFHLKSGCPRKALDTPADPCPKLRTQTTLLHDRLAARPNNAPPLVLLGDFNRTLEFTPPDDPQTEMWPNLDVPGGGERDLTAVSQTLPYQKCNAGDPFDSYIDQIVVSASLVPRLGAAAHVTQDPADVAAKLKISDHCAVRVELRTVP